MGAWLLVCVGTGGHKVNFCPSLQQHIKGIIDEIYRGKRTRWPEPWPANCEVVQQ
jgi:hypothetical protein